MIKKLIFIMGLMFASIGFATTPFVSSNFQTIVQNTTNQDFLVFYTVCNFIMNKNPDCSNEKQIKLSEKSNNYDFPILTSIDNLSVWMQRVSIDKVINLSTQKTQIFNNNCGVYYSMPGGDNIGVLTLSFLVDNSNLIVCTPGGGKK